MDRNTHVKEYLEYYIKFEQAPHFAVLLNGPWGIGKSFLIKEFMKPFADEGLRWAYVSLYGLTSHEEIDDALFRAMYPVLNHKGVQIAGRLAKSAGKFFRLETDLSSKDFRSSADVKVFVFDDIERCHLPINKVLGYINEFVEHEGRKVIIIANEKEIKDCEDYRRIREKLIGKTLEIQSAFEQALEVFLSSMQDCQTRGFLTAKKDEISEIYHQSELHSLRILQQAMWDFERIFVVLEEKHRANDTAITALLRLLFALSFELKAGRLTVADFEGRTATSIIYAINKKDKEGDPPPFVTAQERYPEVDLESAMLSDETLIDFLTKGIVETDRIHRELNASSFFVTVADEPAWRTVWYYFDRAEAEVDTALKEMERAFSAREYTVTGEILHVFGLRLWLAKIGAIPQSIDEVVVEGIAYIDDLYAKGDLEILQNEAEFHTGAYGGLGFSENGTPEHQQLYEYTREKRRASTVDQYPNIADEFLSAMTNDPDQFLRQIVPTSYDPHPFCRAPALASLDPDTFVSKFLNLHTYGQRMAFYALKGRYENGLIERYFEQERPWATEVRNRLYAAAERMAPISKYRLHNQLDTNLDIPLGLGRYATQEPSTDTETSDQ